MVRILISVVIYAISLVGNAQSNTNMSIKESTFKVNIQINKVSSDQGKIYFGLYDSQESFTNRKPLKRTHTEIKNGKAIVVFENLKPGIYAITCYHDANSNGQMDFELSGIPTEDYGMTNNIMSFGPPQFVDGKFELINKDLTFEIKF